MEPLELTALSVMQPWAYCMFRYGKDVENRTWRSNYRGKILIHASKNFDMKAYEYLYMNREKYNLKDFPSPGELKAITGGFVGIVDMVSCRRRLPDNIWKQDDMYGWIFKNPVELQFTPFKGKLSLFSVPLTNTLKRDLCLTEAALSKPEGIYY